MKPLKLVLLALMLLATGMAMAAIKIPKASGKALGVTKGKPVTTGLVFIDGHYIEPPYVVERWGVGLRINGTPVVSQVIDWTEFLKTQEGVQITKTENAPAADPEGESDDDLDMDLEDDEEEDDDSDSSLDDLFDDDPKPKKEAKKPAKKKAKRKPPKPTTTISVTFDGEFTPNDATKALLEKINRTRTDINVTLLKGGFICFGEKYARVSGDGRIAMQILEKLPDIERGARSAEELISGVRSASLLYLTEPICRDLYRNRVDYLKLQTRRDKEKKDRAFKKLLDGMDDKPRL